MNSPTHSGITQGKEIANYTEGTKLTAGANKKQRRTKSASKRRKTESTSSSVNIQSARPDIAHVKGRRGSLKLITEIPLDTLQEIFRNVEPIDLLHLSWASKSLHTILMGKSARYIWKEAFERLYASENPPPPCPEDVNLAQYSHFLFTRKCMECQAGGKCWASWVLRLRLCSDCLQSERFTAPDRGPYIPLIYYFPVIRTQQKIFCLTRDYSSQIGNRILPRPDTRRAQLEAREEDTHLFHRWEQNRKGERDRELKQLRQERRTAIFNKLTEVGCTESEVRELTRRKMEKLPGFSMAKKLTVKDWDALQPKLFELLQKIKTEQIETESLIKISRNWRKFRGHQYWSKRGESHNFSPRPVDLVFYEPFKSAIFTPSEEVTEFSQADFTRVEKEWTETRNKIVLSMLPKDCPSRVATTDGSQLPLLATFIFSASARWGRDTYYTMDAMCKARDTFFSRIAPEGSVSPEELEILAMINRNPGIWSGREDKDRPWMWDHKRFKFCPKAHELAKEMLVYLGLDPHTTTISQMRRRKERFKCTCYYASRMTWNAAITHELEMHDKQRKPGIPPQERWQVITAKPKAF